jgi:hypothetical protein
MVRRGTGIPGVSDAVLIGLGMKDTFGAASSVREDRFFGAVDPVRDPMPIADLLGPKPPES